MQMHEQISTVLFRKKFYSILIILNAASIAITNEFARQMKCEVAHTQVYAYALVVLVNRERMAITLNLILFYK